MKHLRKLAIVIALSAICACGQPASIKDGHPNQIMGNRCFPKGGLGIITVDLYIVLNSTKNELILKSGQRWSGEGVRTPELVVVFGDRVWHQNDLPRDFDLSKAVVVSFEANAVKFAQLDSMFGGYYDYEKPAPTRN